MIFTCNHCPWAKAWETRIAELGNTYRQRGVGVIAINANDPTANAEDSYDGMVTRAKALDFQFPYVVDNGSTVARAFGAERTPEAFCSTPRASSSTTAPSTTTPRMPNR